MSIERILKRHNREFVPPRLEKPMSVESDDDCEITLAKAIDKYLTSRNARREKKLDGFHPSNHSTCPRYWFLLFQGAEVEPKIDARLYRVFDNGHEVHERWYSYFDGMGVLVEKEKKIRVEDPVPISGTVDAIIDWGGKKVVEVKSISQEGFDLRKFYKKPKKDHVEQLQVYLSVLEIDIGLIIYESKNTQDFKIFRVDRDESIYTKRIKTWQKYYKNIQEGKLPPRPYTRTSKACSECELETYCWDKLER